MPLTSLLRDLRHRVQGTWLAPVLRNVGLMAIARRFYFGQILRHGQHRARILGESFVFSVSAPREINRVDGDIRSEVPFLERIVKAVGTKGCLFDIGGNIGLVSLVVAAKTKATGVRVHAFEPEPRNASQFRTNIRLNNLPNVQVHELALGREVGIVDLFVSGETGTGTHSIGRGAEDSRSSVSVPMKTVDTVVTELAQPPTVVKIDVEGAEMEVLLGMKDTLTSGSVEHIFIEIHHGRILTPGYAADDIERWIQAFGFERAWAVDRQHERHCQFTRRGRNRGH